MKGVKTLKGFTGWKTLGGLLLVCSHAVVALSARWGATDERVALWIGLGVLQNLLWVALWLGLRANSSGHTRDLKILTWSVAFGSVCVAALAYPPLETDYYRYAWDGAMLLRGINPWSVIPKANLAPELQPLVAGMNFPELATIYPPGAQALFALLWKISGEQLRFFALAVGAGGWLFFVLRAWRLARRLGLSSELIAGFALHPLLIREWVSSVHFDGWMMGAWLWALSAQRASVRGALWASAVQLKAIPLLFVPIELLFLETGRDRRRWVLGFLGVFAVVLAPALLREGSSSWLEGLRSWGVFTRDWEMNAGPARWLREALYALTGDYDGARLGSRLGMGALFALGAGLGFRRLWRLRARASETAYPFEGLAIPVFFAVWLGPVVNTWYLTWSLAFLPFIRRPWATGLALAVVPVALSDFFYLGQRVPGLPLTAWWNLEHAWIILCLGWTWLQVRRGESL